MNILLTVAHLNGWHGSVIQVIEYAEMLSKENHVAIVCLDYVSKLKELLNKINVNVFCITDENIPLEYDLVYSFHYPLFSYLLQKGISTKKWVAGSLSPTTGIESFPSYVNAGERFPEFADFRFPVLGKKNILIEADGSDLHAVLHPVGIRLQANYVTMVQKSVQTGSCNSFIVVHEFSPFSECLVAGHDHGTSFITDINQLK